jgi:hypothetical protein
VGLWTAIKTTSYIINYNKLLTVIKRKRLEVTGKTTTEPEASFINY